MVMSQIRALYRDENDLPRTVVKRIYEKWDKHRQQWELKRIVFIFEDPELPLHTDTPQATVEHRHGWIIPPEWQFISEKWEQTRSCQKYNHESKTHLLDGDADTPIIKT